MKKLLILLLLFPLALFSQTKIVLKGTQVTISSLANIAGLSVVANATGSPATPTAVLLGVGLTFSGGKLCIDTLNFKDTIYALNGLQILGVGYNRIGLGGFLSQNTTISGSNLYAFTLDSMQAATGRGFRVNFGSDAGWDIPVRDSATGFWTRVGKGTVGQVLTMLGAGGIGWGAGGGSNGFTVSTAANTANYTVPAGKQIFVYLSDLTGQNNRNVVLPSATSGDEYIFVNLNTPASTFNWTFTVGTVKDYGQSTITTLTNQTAYRLIYGGTNFQITN